MAGRRLVLIIASLAAVAALPVSAAGAKPPATFDPVVEAQNFSITQQRQTIYDTPQLPGAARGRQCDEHRAGDVRGGQRPRAILHRRPVLEPLERLRGRHSAQ